MNRDRPFVFLVLAAFLAATALDAWAQERAVQKQVRVNAPLAAVWQAWTTTEGVKTFFAPDANVEARVDGPFEIYFDPYAKPGNRGADGMRILALQDKRMLSFTWNAPPHLPEARGQRTTVTVRLKALAENDTEVTLYHGGWGDGGQWDQAYLYFDRAWGAVLANLQKRFAEGKPIDWSDWLKQLKAMHAAPTPLRVRGTITAVEGNLVSVKSREGKDLKMELAKDATFSYMKKLSLADVKPGTPLGTSAVAGPDGKIVALELHLFPAGRPVPGEGHRLWDLEPNSTMTNGTVTAVVEAGNGRELTLSYKDGAQRVVVPAGIPIVTSQASDRSLLVVGEYAFIAATVAADGKITAQRLQVSKDGVRPPQ